LSLIAIMALPAVKVGAIVALFTWNAWRGLHAFVLSEVLWLLVLSAIAVAPAHGESKGIWVNPVRNVRLMHDTVKAGRPYVDALKETAPTMQRELETDSVECYAQRPSGGCS
jgi:hypothetical protein